MVVGVVSRVGAWRRQLYRPADPGFEERTRRARRHALLQHGALRVAPVALDHRRPELDAGVSATLRYRASLSLSRPEPDWPRHRVFGDADVSAGGRARPDGRRTTGGLRLHDLDASQLGDVASRPRSASTLPPSQRRRASLRVDGTPGDGAFDAA